MKEGRNHGREEGRKEGRKREGGREEGRGEGRNEERGVINGVAPLGVRSVRFGLSSRRIGAAHSPQGRSREIGAPQ